MCTAVWINGEEIASRDALEAVIGGEVFYHGDDERLDEDHCLCPVDVPGTMVEYGYTVRHWREGDPGMPSDYVATR